MNELLDTNPDVHVQPAEYLRLLGYPRGHMLDGRACELAEWARQWYADHGRPWVYVRQAASLEIGNGFTAIDGVPFSSERLRQTLSEADAHGAVLVAVAAGPEAEDYAQQLWREEKPDEYFFLEVFASAVVEHLTTMTGARLCDWSEARNMAVLPHYSPGYAGWDIVEQAHLLELIAGRADPFPSPLAVLESGALRPKKSLLAVFGLTRHVDRLPRLTDVSPCENCSYGNCRYRRAPYRRGPSVVLAGAVAAANGEPRYRVNLKALKRWAAERLSLQECADGSIAARFRYDGTTCTNMGRALAFDYTVRLGPGREGYPIREQRCTPAPGDTGHTQMCQYLANAEPLMAAIAREHPLAGQPLEDVLSWSRSASAAGCYCDAASREHKWGLVLETIHYALAQRNRQDPPAGRD